MYRAGEGLGGGECRENREGSSEGLPHKGQGTKVWEAGMWHRANYSSIFQVYLADKVSLLEP